MDSWPSQQVSAAWFATSTAELYADKLYRSMTDSEPDRVQRNRSPSQTSPFLSLAQGLAGDQALTVQVAVGRVDFVLSAPETLNEPKPLLSHIPVEASVDRLLGYLAKLEDSALTDALRLSIILNLVNPTKTAHEAHDIVANLVGLNIPFNGQTDLQFQINQRSSYKKRAIKINRLVRYAAENMQIISIPFNPGNGMQGQPIIEEQQAAATLLMDFNTVPEGFVLNQQVAIEVLNHIAHEAKRFAADRTISGLGE